MDWIDREDAKNAEAAIQYIHKVHLEEVMSKRIEFEEKQQSDIERYFELERQKVRQLEEFQGKIAELKLFQDKVYKDTQMENSIELK